MWCWCSSKDAVAPGGLLPGKDLLKAVALSCISYFELEEFKKNTEYFKADDIQFMEDKVVDTQLYIVLSKTDRILYVAFRGTTSAVDRKMDRTGALVALDGICDPRHPRSQLKVVEGFKMQLDAVKDRLLKYIDDHINDFDELFICGHSLGAAVATIFAAVYGHHNSSKATPINKIVKCITIGCPRVGNKHFARYYNSLISPENHWRVYNHRDFIAKIALPIVTHHIPGNSVRIHGSDSNKYTVIQKDTKAVPIMFVDGLSAHDSDLYMKSVAGFFPELKADHAELTKYWTDN